MTTTRRSSARLAGSGPEPSTPESTSTPQNSTPSTATPIADTSDLAHEKKDQQLEAKDPDLSSETTTTMDQVKEAVSTPINTEIQEEPEVVQKSPQPEDTPAHEDEPIAKTIAREEEEPVHSVNLVGHIKGVPHPDQQRSDKVTDVEREVEATSGSTSGHAPHAEDSVKAHNAVEPTAHHESETENHKHSKRPVHDDPNSVADEEAQDYLAGAYKSPFRHVHKVEKAGKEER